jgi:uncharacterized protein GlcG (DUF336 family)
MNSFKYISLKQKIVIGAIGISGAAGDEDEICAMAGAVSFD